MSALRKLLQDYLTMRRALGFKMHVEGIGLLSFVTYMEQAQADFISTDLALAWAKQPTMAQPIWWAHRLSFVRGFARYCHAIDPRSEVPPSGLLSTIAGIRLFGAISRKDGSNCSPSPILTGTIRYSIPASSRNIVILWPFGVVQ